MADTIITPEFRAAYVGLFRPSAPKDNPNGPKKYSIRAMFPPTADISALKAAASEAARTKWGSNIPKVMRSPFRRNDELENPVAGIGDDWIVMTFSANESAPPGVVDETLQRVIDDSKCYSGAWFAAEVRSYAYDQAGNKGVGFGLQNVMKTRDDEPIGNGRRPPEKVFAAFAKPSAGGGARSADAIFD